MVFPLVEYAKRIGRNTADFDANDIAKANKWWDSLHKNHILKKEFANMGKILSSKKQQAMNGSVSKSVTKGEKPTKQQIQKVNLDELEMDQELDEDGQVIENGEMVDNGEVEVGEVEEMEMGIEEVIEGDGGEDEPVVADVGFTQRNIDAMLWAINTCLSEFEFSGSEEMQQMEADLIALKNDFE